MSTIVDIIDAKQGLMLQYFFENPSDAIHLRALARRIKVSPTWVSKTARFFARRGLIKVVRMRDRKELSISANREHHSFIWLKRGYNLTSLQDLTAYLVERYDNPTGVIVVGDYAAGNDVEGSDIHIAVISSHHARVDVSKFSRALNRSIYIEEVHPNSLTKKLHLALANGITLHGSFN